MLQLTLVSLILLISLEYDSGGFEAREVVSRRRGNASLRHRRYWSPSYVLKGDRRL